MKKRTTKKLSHMDAKHQAAMVNVGQKPITARSATAAGLVRISPALARAIRRNLLAKGDLLATARLAGMIACKRTAEIIPLCHDIPLEHIQVNVTLRRGAVHIQATVRACWKTGVEMEALVAVSAAALTVYDMGKAVDRSMVIGDIRLLTKTGGTKGDYRAPPTTWGAAT